MSANLIRLMQAFFPPMLEGFHDGVWRPDFDVYQTHNGWLVKVDLAGVNAGDINVVAHGRRLLIRGIRRDRTLEEECRCYVMEISYGPFERYVDLPCEVDSAQIKVDYRDGMLVIRVVTEEGNP
jgi:HSP20 family protein